MFNPPDPDTNAVSTDPEWMTTMDRRILDLLFRTTYAKPGGLWLKPVTVAENLPGARSYVNGRLVKLHAEGYVDRREDGWYRISEQGLTFVQG